MTKKLILFGDSHMGHVGRNLITDLEKRLGNESDIYNCAAGGWTSQDMVKKADYISQLKPDTIIISDGTNDTNPARYVDPESYKQNIEALINVFSGSKIIFVPAIPMNEKLLSRKDGEELSNEKLHKYHDDLTNTCAENNIQYIDAWQLFSPLLKRGDNYHDADGLHLNDHGYDILFNEIVKVMEP